ncbi:MAG: hypothetical protein ACRECA_04315 [Pseudolabrys sp.]
MTLRTFGYAALIAVATTVLVIGAAGTSQAKGKKKMAEAPPPMPATCWFSTSSPVCATKSGMKNTYFNACYAQKDGWAVASKGECKPAKMAKKSMKKMKMKM